MSIGTGVLGSQKFGFFTHAESIVVPRNMKVNGEKWYSGIVVHIVHLFV
jgi:hypothetical protein